MIHCFVHFMGEEALPCEFIGSIRQEGRQIPLSLNERQ